jgi:structural maintenance of chromosome 3 (chondroitin sulfate proteoglycan 6)
MAAGNPTSFPVRFNVSVAGEGTQLTQSAIRFVLSDQYTSMSREDRQQLLHEGTSTSTTLSAFVEIVFDSEL